MSTLMNPFIIVAPTDTWTANNVTLSQYDAYLVAAYQLNQSALTVDSSPSGNDNATTNSGSVAESATGKDNYCAEYNHTSQGLIKTSSVGDFTFGSDDFMISGWINTDNVSDYNSIVNTNNSGTGSAQSWTVFQTNGAKILFEINSALQSIQSTSSVSAGTWHHFAITKVSNRYDLYFDGASEANFTNATTLQTPLAFAIGTFYPDALGTHQMDGELDAIYIWKNISFADQAAATAVVSALFNSTTGSFYRSP